MSVDDASPVQAAAVSGTNRGARLSTSQGLSVPEVSVVIATYNMGQFCAQAVRSCLAQTMNSLEVIVVDDGSTDKTSEVLRTFEAEPRVRLVRQPNLGQPRAKNAGLRLARGRFVAFCDADDYWLPDKLARQLPLFEADPRVGVVCSPIVREFPDGSRQPQVGRRFYRGDVLQQMFIRNIVPFGTAVVRRRCFDEVGPFDESIGMGIDWDLWLRIATRWHFDYVPEPTYVYRVWEGQMSRNWRGRYDCALRIMAKFLEQNPGLLPKSLVSAAYADTYTNLARKQIEHDGFSAAWPSLRRALASDIQHWAAWRLLLGYPLRRLRQAVP